MIPAKKMRESLIKIGVAVAFISIVFWFAFRKPSDGRAENDLANFDNLIETAEKEGRWQDAQSLRLQKERAQTKEAPKKIIIEQALNGSDKISVYKAGSTNQKMALCDALVRKAKEVSGVDITTADLYACINEATKGTEADDMTVAEVASACVVLIDNM